MASTGDPHPRPTDPLPAPDQTALLDASARGATTALVRALELHDPSLAERGAVRAAVADWTATALELPTGEHTAAMAGALLADIAALVSHRHPGDDDTMSSVLGANLIGRSGVGAVTAAAVRHHLERWDGTGGPHGLAGDAIPRPARLVALARALVEPPGHGTRPNWAAGANRARALAGTWLDPDLTHRVVEVILAEPPPPAAQTVDRALARLEELVPPPDRASPIEALTSIGAAIHATDRIDAVLALIAEHARRALGASIVSIGRLDHGEGNLQVLVNVGTLPEGKEQFPADQLVALSSFPEFTAFRTARAHALIRDALPPASPEAEYLDQRGIQAEMAVTIIIDTRPWGLVWASSLPDHRELDESDLATLRLVASQIAAGVNQAARLAELEDLALRDPLTGLRNRRVLDTKLRHIFARPAVARQDCALIMCDVDGLKEVNDTLGHAAGDAVLLDAADALRRAAAGVRGATVCRIGGDEFCIILDAGGLLLAEPVAEQACTLFAESDNDRSMSYGVAVASPDMSSPTQLMQAADAAQYVQKRKRGAKPSPAPTLVGRRARRDQ